MTFLDEAVLDRTTLDSVGATGAQLERVTLADGRVLVVKTLDRRTDWLMEAAGDDGRIFRLWNAGVLQRLPKGIDSAVESVDEISDGWLVAMRDASDSLVPPGQLLTREQSRRVINAVAGLHDAFAATRIDGLCPLVDRLGFLTPASVRGVTDHPLRSIVLEGWDRFATLAPADIGSSVAALLERPGRLAAALARFPETLLHGDLKVANLGFTEDAVVLLDWGTLTGMGPPAVDHAWYLAVNSAAIDASLDDVLADIESVLGPEDRAALPLALLGQVVLLGWEKALGATSDDPVTAAREKEGLAWWCRRAGEALEQWSPA